MCEYECSKTGASCCMECDRVGACDERCEDIGCDYFDSEWLDMVNSKSYRKAKEQGVD